MAYEGEDLSGWKGRAMEIAQENGLDPATFYGMITQESHWKNVRDSYTGTHYGLGQVDSSISSEYGSGNYW